MIMMMIMKMMMMMVMMMMVMMMIMIIIMIMVMMMIMQYCLYLHIYIYSIYISIKTQFQPGTPRTRRFTLKLGPFQIWNDQRQAMASNDLVFLHDVNYNIYIYIHIYIYTQSSWIRQNMQCSNVFTKETLFLKLIILYLPQDDSIQRCIYIYKLYLYTYLESYIICTILY